MKLYIAGRITGIELEAYELFLAAENLLCHHGHTPLNPMRMVDQEPGRKYGEYLADALTVLLTQAEGVYFLDNWRESRGAMIERHIAKTLNIPMYFSVDALPIGSDWPERKD